jgi:hypothetical protein
MLAEAVTEAVTQVVTLEQVMHELHQVGRLVTVVLIIQVLTAIVTAWGQRKIARNEVQLGDLTRQASAGGESKP